MGYLDEGASYSMALFDNNAENCQGNRLNTIGSFTANERRRGSLEVGDSGIDLQSADSVIDAYIGLIGSSGETLDCCRIKEYQRYWGDGGPESDHGGDL